MGSETDRYSVYNLVGFVVSNLTGFAGGVIVARLVGAQGVGAISVAWMVIELLRPWGIISVLPAIRRYNQSEGKSGIFGTSMAMHVAAMVPAAALMAIFSRDIASVFDSRPSVVAMTSIFLLAFIPSSVGIAYLDARREFLKRNLILIAGNVSYIVFLLLIAVPSRTLESVVLSSLLSTAVPSILCIRYLERPTMDRALGAHYLRYGLPVLVVSFINQGILWTGIGLSGALFDASEAGVFRISITWAYFTLLLPQQTVSIWLFTVASMQVAKNEGIAPLYRRSMGTSVGLALLVMLGLVFAGRTILGLYGADFVDGYRTMVLLSAGYLLLSFTIAPLNILYSYGRVLEVTYVTVGQGLVFVCALLGLWPVDAMEIAMALTLSSLVPFLLLNVLALRRSRSDIADGGSRA